jgi:hypothetical protein
VEILELLFALVQGCGCFLEVMALGSNLGAGVTGVKAHQTRKIRNEARTRGEPTPPHNGWFWAFLALAVVGFVLVGLTIWKYAR